MAKKLSPEQKYFNVAVVGLSGTEKDRGVTGIGKSCLCNRFVRPHEDDYSTNHISVISQTDFGGTIVNNDHFLYWGEVTKTSNDGVDYTFQVIEQTEFIDDSSFQPFKSGKHEPYYKRCANLKLQSSEKLMYICKDQLGIEHEYEQRYLPDGRVSIDGFLCLFDVSSVHQRVPDRQTEHTQHILSHLLKTKKPVVLVTTKHDDACDTNQRELEKLLSRKELKSANLVIVETSAQENVNVEVAFLALAQLMDKTNKRQPKVPNYTEAMRALNERKLVASEAYNCLMRSQVLDHKVTWTVVHRRLKECEDYCTYVKLCGTNNAKKVFRRHVKQLRDEFLKEKQDRYLERLRSLLMILLPDLDTIADRSWPSIQRWLERQDFFSDYFVRISDGCPWRESDIVESDEQRIPFDLLDSEPAELVYRTHLSALRSEYKRAELKRQFKQLLEENNNVCPGKSLGDVSIFFIGRECFTALTEMDKAKVYEEYEQELREKAKLEFKELLLEHAELFSKFQYQVTSEGLREINECLKTEPRCMALRCIPDERKMLLLEHLGFIQSPCKTRCPAGENCVDYRAEKVLSSKARRPQSWSRSTEFLLKSDDKRLNLVLLGAEGLADQLALEIRMQCVEDEYTLDGEIYSLDYRPIDGDVTLPQNSFKTVEFTPHGCFCVFNSPATLEFIRDSLEKTILSDLNRHDNRRPFQGLPIVAVLAYDPDISENDLLQLREEGQSLADRLQCPFIDIPTSMMVDPSKRFHCEQIKLAMCSLIQCIKHRSSFVIPWEIVESIEPDIRILMCFMCGDSFDLELPLAPLLNHQCCYVTSVEQFPTVNLETYLDDKRKVEVTVTSYHGASLLRDDLFHGYILVYSAKRTASLANLNAFALQIGNLAPTKVLAVTERGSANAFFHNEQQQLLITEGNALADSLQGYVSFMTTCVNFHTQTASYTPFFKECWDRKTETETTFEFNEQTTSYMSSHHGNDKWLANRPPAALPHEVTNSHHTRKDAFTTFGKGSTSNSQSTEDSETIYDQPHSHQCLSDSEGEPHYVNSSQFINHHHHSNHTNHVPNQSSNNTCDTNPYATVPIFTDNYGGTNHTAKANHVFKGQKQAVTDKFRNSYPSASNPVKCYAIETTFPVNLPTIPPLSTPPFPEKRPETPPFPLDVDSLTPTSCFEVNLLSSPATTSMTQSMIEDSEPRYQFRKSNSMKLALNESDEGNPEEPSDRKQAPPTYPKPKYPQGDRKPGQLDLNRYGDVRYTIDRNIKTTSGPLQQGLMIKSHVKAPLATPEHEIEVSQDYAVVKDALSTNENEYAEVVDALPGGHLHRIRSTKPNKGRTGLDSATDSEFSSLERDHAKTETIYTRVNRKPTPHKKKGKNRGAESVVPTVPPPPPPPLSLYQGYGGSEVPSYADRYTGPWPEGVDKLRSSSPSEGSEGTGDEIHGSKKPRKRRSFKKKKDKDNWPYTGDETTTLLTKSDLAGSNLNMAFVEDENSINSLEATSPRLDGEMEDPNDSGKWKPMNMLGKLIPEKDPEKQKRKKIMKEEEKKIKEQQKAQKKLNKAKNSKISLNSSATGSLLEDMGQSETNPVPGFVEMCVTHIEREGMGVEGIYRVPGNKANVELLMERFKEDENVDIKAEEIPVNAVATALKQFFSDLKEPLIPTCLHEELTEASGISEKQARLLAVRGLLKKLPRPNFEVLKYLVAHIYRVSENFQDNKMPVENLAVCWWPTLLRPDFKDFESMSQVVKYLEDVVKLLIEQHLFLFHGEQIAT